MIFVCAFEYEADAEAFFKVLEVRLEKFALQVAAANKTRVLHFSRSNQPGFIEVRLSRVRIRWT